MPLSPLSPVITQDVDDLCPKEALALDLAQMFDPAIFPVLAADGLTNGAVYALLSLALVLVFAVTRVIFVAQGEFVSFGALTLASLQLGKVPGTLWLVLALLTVGALVEGLAQLRQGHSKRAGVVLLGALAVGAGLWALLTWLAPLKLALPLQVLLTLLLVVPLGPLTYRLAFMPLREASTLVLLIAAVSLHLVLGGLGLVFFGAEGSRTPAFAEGQVQLRSGAAQRPESGHHSGQRGADAVAVLLL